MVDRNENCTGSHVGASQEYSQLSLRQTPFGPLLCVRLRSLSYRESNNGSKEKQGPTLGVRLTEVSVKRELTVSYTYHMIDWRAA